MERGQGVEIPRTRPCSKHKHLNLSVACAVASSPYLLQGGPSPGPPSKKGAEKTQLPCLGYELAQKGKGRCNTWKVMEA